MKRQYLSRKALPALVLITGLTVAAGLLAPAEAQAAIRVQASVNVAPVRASVVLGDGPRLCSIPKPIERRTVVLRECGSRCDRDDRCDRGERYGHKGKHRRHHEHKVWVDGYWERTGPRTARWIPGHWERW